MKNNIRFCGKGGISGTKKIGNHNNIVQSMVSAFNISVMPKQNPQNVTWNTGCLLHCLKYVNFTFIDQLDHYIL